MPSAEHLHRFEFEGPLTRLGYTFLFVICDAVMCVISAEKQNLEEP